jgi:uncharacterized membrane protein YeaQ/YmgE (transglycosylase-associated protein family)
MKRLTLYSKPIFSSETGMWRAQASAAWRSAREAGEVTVVAVGLVGEIAAEEFVGAFAAEHDSDVLAAHLGQVPDGDGSGVGAGLVGVVGQLTDDVGEIGVVVQIEFGMVGAEATADLAGRSGSRRRTCPER